MGEIQTIELINFIQSMSEEDQKVVIAALPSSLLWDELKERDQKKESIIAGINSLLK